MQDSGNGVSIAILGAGGFVGSHLVEHLISRGEHTVVGVDISDEKIAHLPEESFTFHRADIRDQSSLLHEVIANADITVDLVAYANPSLYVTSPIDVFELNFVQNLHVARICMQHGTRLIQYSSAEVYGKANSGERYSEDKTDSVFGPIHKQRWIYGTGKMLLEQVLYAHGLAGDLDYTIVRPFNFIGSRLDYLVPPGSMQGPRVFAHFMSALLTGGPLYLVNGGRAHRAFLHIADANAGFQAVIDHADECRNEVFNLGNPDNNLTIRELAESMIEIYRDLTGEHVDSPLVEVSGEEFYGPGYEDSDRLPPDISKMRSLGWEPRRDLRETLRDAMAHYVREWKEGRLDIAQLGVESGNSDPPMMAASDPDITRSPHDLRYATAPPTRGRNRR